MAQLRDWMQLVRVPNSLTACADSIAGFSFVVGPWFNSQESFLPVAMVSIASIALYWAGMAMNDVNDVERDRDQRRLGPLVSERISVTHAATVSWILFGTGIVFAAAAGLFASAESMATNPLAPYHFAPAAVAGLLTMTILAYDSRLKQSILGPWLMGLCRSLNLALGMAVGAITIEFDESLIASILPGGWLLLAGHGLFVVGLTLAARKESMMIQSRSRLGICWGVSVLGLVLIAISPRIVANDIYQRLSPTFMFPILIALIAAPWALRVVKSIKHPNVSYLVPAIKQSILTILFLDAAVAAQFGNTGPGVLIGLFAIPTFLMGRYFRMT